MDRRAFGYFCKLDFEGRKQSRTSGSGSAEGEGGDYLVLHVPFPSDLPFLRSEQAVHFNSSELSSGLVSTGREMRQSLAGVEE